MFKIPLYDVRLVRRRTLSLAEDMIGDTERAARALHALIGLTDREHLACLFLDNGHRVTGAHIAAVGGQGAIQGCDPRTILRAALLARASAMVIGHNHPSGDKNPSAEDFNFTAHLMRAANVVGIPIVDHVIVTAVPNRYHSMHIAGTMPRVGSEP